MRSSVRCLRIASYNVRLPRHRRQEGRAAHVRVIEELGCDTVGLQEVDYRLDYIAQARHAGHSGLTLARHDGLFGNALLTRRKVLDVRRLLHLLAARAAQRARRTWK